MSKRDPTLREMRATLANVYYEVGNRGGVEHADGALFQRIYDQMAWLLDAFLFDVEPESDDGGRS